MMSGKHNCLPKQRLRKIRRRPLKQIFLNQISYFLKLKPLRRRLPIHGQGRH